MGKYVIDETTLTAIGDSIRKKTGKTAAVAVTEMAAQIEGLNVTTDVMAGEYVSMVTGMESDTLTEIPGNAFKNFKKLKTVSFPNVTVVGESGFYGCKNLENISLPEAVTIGKSAFSHGTLTSDHGVGLTAISLPKATRIGDYAFCRNDNLASLQLPLVEHVGYCAFEELPALTSISLPNGYYLDVAAFSGDTALQSVSITGNIYMISALAFRNCTALKTVVIPQVRNIKSKAFSGCTALQTVDMSKCTAVPTLADADAFQGVPSTCRFRVPSALLNQWKAATNWSVYASQIIGV